jgi:DNA-directed RNA polymerase specialized sigma24 family protein
MEIHIDSAEDQAVLSAIRERRYRQAAAILIRYYGNSVFNVCRSLIPELEIAEDLTQQSFSRAFSSLSGIQGQTSLRVWLMNVAQRCCADYLHQEANAGCGEMPPIDLQAASEIGAWSIRESLQRRLEVLAQAL